MTDRSARQGSRVLLAVLLLGPAFDIGFAAGWVGQRQLSRPHAGSRLRRLPQHVEVQEPTLKDCRSDASALLNGMRTPAALLAGAAFGGAFGLPLSGDDTPWVGAMKRLYVVLGCGSLCSELLAVMLSTLAINRLSAQTFQLHPSSTALLTSEMEMEWVGTQFNFTLGLVLLFGSIACRAFLTIKCPKLAHGVVAMVAGCMFFICAILNDENNAYDNTMHLGWRYLMLLCQRTRDYPGIFKAFSWGFSGFAAYSFLACYRYVLATILGTL
mmetsp:Transcript_47310/g.106327  ORF Transcript_47310/g.106327 Transcript_47310/m.106327 type:complete len:270 (+) Transcript_47310:61-870(+)